MNNAIPTARGRGRPRGGPSGTRERILTAAAEEFGELGYDGATIRAIAGRAGVDTALVHHYFGTKSALFAAVVDFPIDPVTAIPSMLSGDPAAAGERIARFVLTTWEDPGFRGRGVALVRGAIGSRSSGDLMVGFVYREILMAISDWLGPSEESERRAGLVASEIVGVIVTRYVLELAPMVAMGVEELVAAIGPRLQYHLTGPSMTRSA